MRVYGRSGSGSANPEEGPVAVHYQGQGGTPGTVSPPRYRPPSRPNVPSSPCCRGHRPARTERRIVAPALGRGTSRQVSESTASRRRVSIGRIPGLGARPSGLELPCDDVPDNMQAPVRSRRAVRRGPEEDEIEKMPPRPYTWMDGPGLSAGVMICSGLIEGEPPDLGDHVAFVPAGASITRQSLTSSTQRSSPPTSMQSG